MKRLLILCASLFACATVTPSPSSAESIACAAEVPAARKGHWYYRIIDGRKCWYDGQPMMPKSSLHWPKEPSVVEAEAVTPASDIGPTTDGRSISPPSTPDPNISTPDPNIWPAPAVDDTSFESRWQALKPRS